jgi:hypothetical protein
VGLNGATRAVETMTVHAHQGNNGRLFDIGDSDFNGAD